MVILLVHYLLRSNFTFFRSQLMTCSHCCYVDKQCMPLSPKLSMHFFYGETSNISWLELRESRFWSFRDADSFLVFTPHCSLSLTIGETADCTLHLCLGRRVSTLFLTFPYSQGMKMGISSFFGSANVFYYGIFAVPNGRGHSE